MRLRNSVFLLSLLILVAACRPTRAQNDSTYKAHALPNLVTGANVRPVGDTRRGYGSQKARETLNRLKKMNVNTVAILMEGYMRDVNDVEIRFKEGEALKSIEAVLKDANKMGLSTILIPHLYIQDGTWRGLIKMSDAKQRDTWWTSYSRFISTAADIAERSGTTMLSLGVELKSMSKELDTRTRMRGLKADVQKSYQGLLTYSANWDEAEDVVFWDLIDVVGVNGYYPLRPDVIRGAETAGRRLAALNRQTGKDVLVLEVGYRAGPMSHVEPWAWPEDVENKEVDQLAQATNWAAILAHWLNVPGVRGLLVWVIPTDPDDPASEPPNGFNPINKSAEEVLRRAFSAYAQKAG